MHDPDRGFALVPLLGVVVVIGLLAAIALPTYMSHHMERVRVVTVADMRNVASHVESYSTMQSYPSGQATFDATDDIEPGAHD